VKSHTIIRISQNQGIEQEITPTCSCGWKGWTEYAHNDHMYSNLKEQEEKHLKDSAEEDKKHLAEQSKQ